MKSTAVAVCNNAKKGQRHVLARVTSRDGVAGLEVREAINPGKDVRFHWQFLSLPEADEMLGTVAACPCGGGKDFQVDVNDLLTAYRERKVIELEPWDKWAGRG